jgi:hypothetical protein
LAQYAAPRLDFKNGSDYKRNENISPPDTPSVKGMAVDAQLSFASKLLGCVFPTTSLEISAFNFIFAKNIGPLMFWHQAYIAI